MPLPSKEDIKCFVFIGVILFAMVLATFFYPYVIRFVIMLFFYWFVSIPVIAISISSIDFIGRRIKLRKAYKAINTVEVQEAFKNSTGDNPLKSGKLTKSYKEWLIQKVAIPKYKYSYRSRFSPRDVNGLIILIIVFVIIVIIFITIYATVFPDYRIPFRW